jgi:hypothetical protein
VTDWMPLIVVATPPTILMGGTLFLGWLKMREQQQEQRRQHEENKGELKAIHIEIDGRMTEMLKLQRESSYARGVADEKESADNE